MSVPRVTFPTLILGAATLDFITHHVSDAIFTNRNRDISYITVCIVTLSVISVCLDDIVIVTYCNWHHSIHNLHQTLLIHVDGVERSRIQYVEIPVSLWCSFVMPPASVGRGNYKLKFFNIFFSVVYNAIIVWWIKISKMMGGVCPSVWQDGSPSHTGNPWTYLEVKRSMVKVTRPINGVTDNAPYASRGITMSLKLACLLCFVLCSFHWFVCNHATTTPTT